MPIHPTAIISREAEIDPTAEVGPHVVIDGPVHVGAAVRIWAGAYLCGWTTIGEGCQIHMGAVVGHEPQDRAYKGERSYCEIGRGTVLREYVTVHRGTMPESKTIIGQDCLLFANAHVAHNCAVADRVTIMNASLLGGHVSIGPGAVIGGGAKFHQFVRVGDLAMISGDSSLSVDIPPFLMTHGRNTLMGINRIGMLRANMTRAEIDEIRAAYRLLFRSGQPYTRSIPRVAEMVVTPAGRRFAEFLQANRKRPLVRARGRRAEGPESEAG